MREVNRRKKNWWTVGDSNPRLPRCERGALPAELTALYCCFVTTRLNLKLYCMGEVIFYSISLRLSRQDTLLVGILCRIPCSEEPLFFSMYAVLDRFYILCISFLHYIQSAAVLSWLTIKTLGEYLDFLCGNGYTFKVKL